LRYTGRKLRQYKPDYGVTCFGVSEWNAEVADIATRFLQGIGYRGLCTLEFARHRGTGRYLLLEANPRSYYPNALATASGLNFPLAEYRLLMGEALPAPARQKDGVHWIDFPRDLGSFYRKMRAGQMTTAAWMRSLSKARSFASFAIDDPAPWLVESIAVLARVDGRRRRWTVRTYEPRQDNHPSPAVMQGREPAARRRDVWLACAAPRAGSRWRGPRRRAGAAFRPGATTGR